MFGFSLIRTKKYYWLLNSFETAEKESTRLRDNLHRVTEDYSALISEHTALAKEHAELYTKYNKLTDRDEKGRFTK